MSNTTNSFLHSFTYRFLCGILGGALGGSIGATVGALGYLLSLDDEVPYPIGKAAGSSALGTALIMFCVNFLVAPGLRTRNDTPVNDSELSNGYAFHRNACIPALNVCIPAAISSFVVPIIGGPLGYVLITRHQNDISPEEIALTNLATFIGLLLLSCTMVTVCFPIILCYNSIKNIVHNKNIQHGEKKSLLEKPMTGNDVALFSLTATEGSINAESNNIPKNHWWQRLSVCPTHPQPV